MNDDFLFADDTDDDLEESMGTWKLLIVDDEPEVHAVTKLALNDFSLNGKSLEFLSAYSGDEAKAMFRQHNDIAVVLLDVVMESDDAGLKVADYIRNRQENHFTRIILRTGQPGQAPEKDVIVNYDINDYKSKTELTAQKLFTVIIAALRSYRDIIVIEEARLGLEKILDATADLFSTRSMERFMGGIIQQLASVLGCAKNAAYITSAVAAPKPIDRIGDLYIVTGNGDYADKEGSLLREVVKDKDYLLCKKALEKQTVVYDEDQLVAYCSSKTHRGSLLFLTGLPRQLSEIDKRLVRKFADNVQLAFDNILINYEIEDTQREIIERLGRAMEQSDDNSQHIRRLTEMSAVLATYAGMHPDAVAQLKMAIALHDVGNSMLPRNVLNKDTPLSEAEKLDIKKHAEFGYQILKDSKRPTIRLAATLARQHHEKWDGSGYPEGLEGKNIALESRIAALVDLFDALYNERPYKSAWPLEKVVSTIKSEAGAHLDPSLVTVFETCVEKLVDIQHTFPDEK